MSFEPPLLYPPFWELETPVLQGFGDNSQYYKQLGQGGHNGLDFGLIHGTAVIAAMDGEVIFSGPGTDHFLMGAAAGECILIRHSAQPPAWTQLDTATYLTGYAHLSRRYAIEGGYVEAGDVIGLVGMTGLASGPHLHFELLPEPLETANGYLGRIDPTAAYLRGVREKSTPYSPEKPPTSTKQGPLPENEPPTSTQSPGTALAPDSPPKRRERE